MVTIAGLSISLIWLWLILAVILMIIEAMTVGLTCIWFAVGALAAMVLAFLKVGLPAQVVVFFAVSIVLLATTRKIFVNKLKTGSEKTNTEALIGEEGVVIEDVRPHEVGIVKVKGQEWSAVAPDNETVIEKGETITVSAIEGVKLIVIKKL